MLRRAGATKKVRIVQRGTPDAEGSVRDEVAVEEPMEIRVSWREKGHPVTVPVAVTMRTPGDDFELAAGFLFTEGIVADRHAVAELTYCRGEAGDPQEYNIVEVRLREGARLDPDRLTRNFYTSSSCGVCGKASLEAVEVRGCAPVPEGDARLAAGHVPSLPERLRAAQSVFERTGGLHAAGLFPMRAGTGKASGSPDPTLVREDVGRHNAVDKVIGRSFLDGDLPLAGRVMVVSGRASFEILQKAVAAGIPALVAVGAPSSLAVDMAERFGVTLVGFARGGTFNVYAGASRIA